MSPLQLPGPGATAAGTVTVSATASDDIGVAGLQFLLDGQSLGTELTKAPYTISVGQHHGSRGRSHDSRHSSGCGRNTTTSRSVTVTVKNYVDPGRLAVAISSPLDDATVAGKVTLQAEVTSNVGVAGVEFQIDGKNLGGELTGGPYVISWDSTAASNGFHVMTAVARDVLGIQCIL